MFSFVTTGSAGLEDVKAFNLKTAQILYKLKVNFKEFSTLKYVD